MGREIRRIPPGWNHPRDDRGRLQPMYDRTYDSEIETWIAQRAAWKARNAPLCRELDVYIPEDREQTVFDEHTFEDWHGGPPDPRYHRPDFGDTATCYQVYETVSEGTPVSPVFESLDDMKAWLVGQGYSEHSAEAFVRSEWAPSLFISDGVCAMNIHAHDLMSGGK